MPVPSSKSRIRRFDEPQGFARLPGVQVFSVGEKRGKEWTEQDLDQIAQNFADFCAGDKPLFRVPAVLGHEEDQKLLEGSDLPAAGWAERCYRDGSFLVVDFGEVPPQVAKLLRSKAYRAVSAEIYNQPPEGVPGKGKMLRRVAFLGGEIPQVKNLGDIPAVEYAERGQVVLRFRESRPRSGAGTFLCFSEVVAMNREEMLKKLAESGYDPEKIKDAPDHMLAEMCRMAEDAPEPEPEQMSEDEKKVKAEEYMAKAKKFGAKFDDKPNTDTPPGTGERQPTKTTTTHQYSEQQLEAAVSKSLQKLLPELQKPLAAKIGELDKFAEERVAQEKRATIKARLQTLVQQGKVLPAEMDGGLEDAAFSLDAKTVHKFSENGKTVSATAFDRFFKALEARPKLSVFGEKIKRAPGARADPDEEQAKVERFAESNPALAHALTAAGRTVEDYVAAFAEAKKKNPRLTAAQYGVPAEVA